MSYEGYDEVFENHAQEIVEDYLEENPEVDTTIDIEDVPDEFIDEWINNYFCNVGDVLYDMYKDRVILDEN